MQWIDCVKSVYEVIMDHELEIIETPKHSDWQENIEFIQCI